jgi:DNA replication and repair protein RecF
LVILAAIILKSANIVFLRKLKLANFKNHPNGDYLFTKKFNAFVGQNGVGKTNLLDLIYFLCLTKSFHNLTDQQLILKDEPFLRVEGMFEDDIDQLHILVKLGAQKKKEFLVNEVAYSKIADHIGKIPLILISPEDSELIHGAAEVRRKLMDSVLSQFDHEYLMALLQYNKVLEQRNSLLKQKSDNPGTDISALDFYDQALSKFGAYIHQKRASLFYALKPIFLEYYSQLSNGAELVQWEYVSQLNHTKWDNLFRERRNKDFAALRTTGGIHRDDLDFFIREEKIKKFGSQGQQKSFLLALKLALYEYIAKEKRLKPILLIDDIFDKLDMQRTSSLFQILLSDNFGQVFITDTEVSRISESLSENESYLDIFRLVKREN